MPMTTTATAPAKKATAKKVARKVAAPQPPAADSTADLLAGQVVEPKAAMPELTEDERNAILAEIRPWVEYVVSRWANEYGRPDAAGIMFNRIFGQAHNAKKPPTEKLAAVKDFVVAETFAQMREHGWCENATKGLSLVFGHPKDENGKRTEKWYDKDGYDYKGFNKDGFNAEGVNRYGYRADGRYMRIDRDGITRWYDQTTRRDEDGFDHDGWDTNNVNRCGQRRNGTWVTPEAHAAFLLKDLSPEMRAVLTAKLTEEPTEPVGEPDDA